MKQDVERFEQRARKIKGERDQKGKVVAGRAVVRPVIPAPMRGASAAGGKK